MAWLTIINTVYGISFQADSHWMMSSSSAMPRFLLFKWQLINSDDVKVGIFGYIHFYERTHCTNLIIFIVIWKFNSFKQNQRGGRQIIGLLILTNRLRGMGIFILVFCFYLYFYFGLFKISVIYFKPRLAFYYY